MVDNAHRAAALPPPLVPPVMCGGAAVRSVADAVRGRIHRRLPPLSIRPSDRRPVDSSENHAEAVIRQLLPFLMPETIVIEPFEVCS